MAVKSHNKLLITLVAVVLGMFGFGFALVPIYNSLCKALNINGKTNPEALAYDANTKISHDRDVLVQFVATNNSGVPWAFYPKVQQIKVHPGEIAKLAFYAENKTPHRMTVQAIPSVTPGIAAKYLKKTECFCFTQQTLNGHEAMDMPLLFHIDSDLPAKIKTITLAYTLFDVTDRAKR
ncbi:MULTISPECIES: cytochrome c oxidase assembly protein [Legionella]|uniref:Cytochrome c oxidase assembly protein CtaG n=1 Tax=Legionella septentrionalis TaxID=2498109 RepID=A0A3S0VA95_9GAMM|nr:MULTISPECIES: cytochrome c oxidase assembly protein [Legionella]MCP0914920.1 cytochrome c oxidase assembly protein [Legionella sp. 27cVA30]RUQ85033.1 cytochrome c oxidase assembly protein [Legionella septentrionalis]RUQ95649.1 cytochrome c oxidase assembly protein [Legionella septentrionalis]RUR09574.1 cytochrome c oxidase assembly protein [Legionella septentrionalis]RUR13859.1 cytochrome c oxidase assembly protein [Legionella septentrionalis]